MTERYDGGFSKTFRKIGNHGSHSRVFVDRQLIYKNVLQ
jgi:hypothetical protein